MKKFIVIFILFTHQLLCRDIGGTLTQKMTNPHEKIGKDYTAERRSENSLREAIVANLGRFEEKYLTLVDEIRKSERSSYLGAPELKPYVDAIKQSSLPDDWKAIYLLFKMDKGDFFASDALRQIYPDLFPKEEHVDIVKEIIQETGGFGNSYFAKYNAQKIQQSHPLYLDTITKLNKNNQSESSFLQRRMTNKNWELVKYYETPKRPTPQNDYQQGVHDDLYDISNKITKIQQNIKNNAKCNKWQIEPPATKTFPNFPYDYPYDGKEGCPNVMLSPKTRTKLNVVKFADNNKLNLHYSEDSSSIYYNCHGFAFGITNFVYYFIDPFGREKFIFNLEHYALLISQLKHSYNLQETDNDENKTKNRKGIRIGSIFDNFMKGDINIATFLDKRIVDLTNYFLPAYVFCADVDKPDSISNNTIVLYADNGILSHSAIYFSKFNKWVSKLGPNGIVTHELEDLEVIYGKPKYAVCEKPVPFGIAKDLLNTKTFKP